MNPKHAWFDDPTSTQSLLLLSTLTIRTMRMLETIGRKSDGASDEALRPSRGVEDAIEDGAYDVSPTPLLTWRMFTLGLLASMGGLIFGVLFSQLSTVQIMSDGEQYDTGQISGFLNMEDFLRRFGQLDSSGNYFFSNTRSGLIVGLVCEGDPCSVDGVVHLLNFVSSRSAL